MQHRHLNHNEYTLAAIDDIIQNGTPKDWVELKNAIDKDKSLLEKIEKICQHNIGGEYSQHRYYFWKNYVEFSK